MVWKDVPRWFFEQAAFATDPAVRSIRLENRRRENVMVCPKFFLFGGYLKGLTENQQDEKHL
jgi:hypothetical protein